MKSASLRKRDGVGVFEAVNATFLTLVCVLCVLPFVNLLAVSFSGTAAVQAGRVTFWPIDFTTASYEFALSGGKFLRSLGVSALRVLVGVSVNLILMVLTAYPLSKTKKEVPGRNWIMGYFVLTMLISSGMIPLYLVVSKLGLKDTIWSLVLPTALPVYNTVILMNFMRGLPSEIEEAARIDGASPIVILTRVLLPLLKPALATVGLFCIVSHWNDWFSGSIYMRKPELYPLQTYLQTLLQSFEQLLRGASPSPEEARELLALFDRDERAFFAELRARPHPERLALRLYAQYALERRPEWEAAGLSEQVYRDTMSDLVLWYREYVRQKGEPGVVEWEWLALPLKRRLVRLGRLQYQPRTLERETTVRGVLYPAGTGVLEVHIPAGDALLPRGADDSLRRAMAFFPPERRALLHCHSWLLAPELRELLPPGSNILYFQSLFDVYEEDFSFRQAEERVFGEIRDDIASYPERTGLQKSLKRYLLSGGKVSMGLGYVRAELTNAG